MSDSPRILNFAELKINKGVTNAMPVHPSRKRSGQAVTNADELGFDHLYMMAQNKHPILLQMGCRSKYLTQHYCFTTL